MPNVIFRIEAEHINILMKLMLSLQKKAINFQQRKEVALTPYHNVLCSIDIAIEETNLKEFLEIVKNEKLKSKIRLYSLKDKYYRPYLIPDEKNSLIYTTFFYQKLNIPESFVETSKTPNIEPSVYNFLENFEITKNDEYMIEGYYKSTATIPVWGQLINTDTGIFNMHAINDNDSYIVITDITNIRDIIISKESYYDELFHLPLTNGLSKAQIVEYYIPFMQDTILHFAENIDIVELYTNINGVLSEKPMMKFSKSKISNKLEENATETINVFLKQQQDYLKRKR